MAATHLHKSSASRVPESVTCAHGHSRVSVRWLACAGLCLAGLALGSAANAQTIPTRTIINGGFENFQINNDAITPVGGYTAVGGCSDGTCERRYSNAQITTEPLLATFGWRSNGPTFPGANTVEIWRNTLGTNNSEFGNYYWVPHGGNQYAEIASNSTSEPLGQSLCVVAGETPSWSVWHRARTLTGANRTDTMRVRLFSPSGAALFTSPTLSANTLAWVNHTGTFPAATQSGAHLFNFEFVTGPAVDAGNFVDDIDIRLSPLFDLRGVVNAGGAVIASVNENGAPMVYLDIMVNGTIRNSNATVTLVRSGAAIAGTDFTVGTPTRGSLTVSGSGDIVLTLPPGNYDPNVLASAQPAGGGRIRIPLQVINDSVIENNEALTYSTGTIVNPGTDLPLIREISGNSAACGSAINMASLVIIDNDVDLLTTKAASTATPAVGVPFTYTVTFQNNTAAPTLAPTTAHDVTAAIADALPAGLTFSNWTCVAANGATCPAASGSGAISGNAVLPAGNAAAGGSVTYTLNAIATGAPNCGVITNTSTITTPSGFQEGTSVQAGFVSPTPGGTANNTASVDVDPVCPSSVVLNKITVGQAGGPFGFALTNTTQPTGTVTTAAPGSPTQVDGDDSAAGVQPFAVAALGTAITINESSIPVGWVLDSATCQSGSTTVGSLTGTTYTIPASSVGENTTFTCTFTNAISMANLSVTKTNTPASGPNDQPDDTVLAGTETTYEIVIGNAGPDSVVNAVLTDMPSAGLVDCQLATPACQVVGGTATCPDEGSAPGELSMDNLQGGGVLIPLLQSGASIRIRMTCTVQ